MNTAGVRSRAESRYDELIKLLRQHNIEYETRELFKEYGAYGTSVFVRANASETHEQPTFVLAIPITTLSDTGGEPHAGFQSAVRFIEMLRSFNKAPPVIVAFLADEWQAPDSGTDWAGFTGLLEWLHDAGEHIILYAGIITPPKKLTLIQASNISTVPLELLSSFFDACKAAALPCNVLTKYRVLYKYGIAPVPPPVRMAAAQEIPLLYIIDEDAVRFSTEEKTAAIDAERLASLFTGWLSRNPYEKAQKEMDNYFIAGLKNTPVFITEWHIMMIWYLFVLILYVCVLCYRHESGLKKTLFLILIAAAILLFMVTAILDLTLLPLVLPALLVLPLGFILYALNKKFRFITKKTPIRFTAVLILCAVPALMPFHDFTSETIRFVKNMQTESYAFADEKTILHEDTSLLAASLDASPFFEHSLLTLSISSQEEAQYYKLLLEPHTPEQEGTEQQLTIIYTATAPYTVNTNGVEFNLGAFPPARCSLEAGVPSAFKGSFVIKAFYKGNRYAQTRVSTN